MCARAYLCVRAHVHARVCVCAYVCMCVCACAYVCACARETKPFAVSGDIRLYGMHDWLSLNLSSAKFSAVW